MRLLALAVVLMTAVVVGVAPTPAHAAFLYCQDIGTFPSERCTVGYQAYPYGQTRGLRSSMQGWPDLGITGTQQSGSDEIRIHLKVWDLYTDGYVARVWVDVFRGCWCVESANHVAALTFDSGRGSGDFREATYTNANGQENYYVVRLRLGRYQSSTGRSEYGEEQRYHLYVYRL